MLFKKNYLLINFFFYLALKSYARNLKYLAEDWAPVGVPLPDILNRDAPVKLEDESNPLYNKQMVGKKFNFY